MMGHAGKGLGAHFTPWGQLGGGFGGSLMNRVHLAESRGPQDSLV